VSWDYDQEQRVARAAPTPEPPTVSPVRRKPDPVLAPRSISSPQPTAAPGPDGFDNLPSLYDPSSLFLLSCLVAPPFLELYEGNLDLTALIFYIVHPVPGTSLLLMMIFLYFTHRKPSNVSASDMRVATWYLVNGFGFKTIMDTFSGSLQSWSLMTAQYNALEGRYQLPLWGHTEAQAVHITSLLEITIQAPLCLLAYYLIIRRPASAVRFTTEFVLATLQAAGTWYFYMPLLTTADGTARLEKFFTSSDPVELYFRGVFGCVICPLIWIVVPLLRVIYGNITLHFLVKGATKR